MKLLDLDYWGAGDVLWRAFREQFNLTETGGYRRTCPNCCMLSMTDIDFHGTRSFIVEDADIGLPYKPDPKIKIGISGTIILNVGVCLKPSCKCPPSVKTKKTLDFGNEDLGTIKYSDLINRSIKFVK